MAVTPAPPDQLSHSASGGPASESDRGATRGLVAFLFATAVAETLAYTAIAPLLPALEDELGLSRQRVGLLAAMYAVGLVVAALPVGLLAFRFGPRPAMIASLVGLAFAAVGFGLADAYGTMLAARFVGGAAGALCFAAGLAWIVERTAQPRQAEMIGLLSAGAAAGAMAGPVVGAAAAVVGRGIAFLVVGFLVGALALVGTRFADPPAHVGAQFLQVVKAHRSARIWRGQWLVALPGVLLGTNLLLVPLRLDELGWGAVGIAGTFLVASFLGVLVRRPVGRWADRQGLISSLRILVAVSIPVTIAMSWIGRAWLLSVCAVVATTIYGAMWGPAMAYVSQSYARARIPQLFGFSVMAFTSGLGLILGTAGAGVVTEHAGVAVAGVLAAAIAGAAFVSLVRTTGSLARS
jgi:predicted MFS family arabinose efflux permease